MNMLQDKKFFNHLKKYIEENQPLYLATGKVSPFNYNKGTLISFELAFDIYLTYQQAISLQQLWEKEKDYSRLLKKENTEFQLKIDNLSEYLENQAFMSKKESYNDNINTHYYDYENVEDSEDEDGENSESKNINPLDGKGLMH